MSKAVSVVLAVRNEWPTIAGTIYSFYEDLRTWLDPDEFEFVVVDNCGTDSTAAILQDKFRRWVSHGLLKVIRFDERPGNVVARNVGARAAAGEVLIHADGHLSISDGTTARLVSGARERGGIWHPSFQMWGDTSDIRCYGYELRLKEKFWGSISRRVPESVPKRDGVPAEPYLIPMASHCCLAVRREEYAELRGYGDKLRVYGGGEPLLDLKWWTTGREVWMEPRALVRHAFGVRAVWRESKLGDEPHLSEVWTDRRRVTKTPEPGEKYLRYGRDYAWTNENLHHNFMAAAYIVGGYGWLQTMYKVFWDRRWGENPEKPVSWRYQSDLNGLRREVLSGCADERRWLKTLQVRSLDDLLASPPWPV